MRSNGPQGSPGRRWSVCGHRARRTGQRPPGARPDGVHATAPGAGAPGRQGKGVQGGRAPLPRRPDGAAQRQRVARGAYWRHPAPSPAAAPEPARWQAARWLRRDRKIPRRRVSFSVTGLAGSCPPTRSRRASRRSRLPGSGFRAGWRTYWRKGGRSEVARPARVPRLAGNGPSGCTRSGLKQPCSGAAANGKARSAWTRSLQVGGGRNPSGLPRKS
jgi:hypothetical protein